MKTNELYYSPLSDGELDLLTNAVADVQTISSDDYKTADKTENFEDLQIVFLNFNGATTSYNNVQLGLSVNDIIVAESGYSDAEITIIVDTLNAQFGGDIFFTTVAPEDTEYSTVFIGITDAFASYGNFLGLAESIDAGNLNHSDNAFVFLDTNTATPDETVSIIAHEIGHIVYGDTHEGEGIIAYASGTVSNGTRTVGWWNDPDDGTTVGNKGRLTIHVQTVTNATILSGGTLTLEDGVVFSVFLTPTARNITLAGGLMEYDGSSNAVHGITVSALGSKINFSSGWNYSDNLTITALGSTASLTIKNSCTLSGASIEVKDGADTMANGQSYTLIHCDNTMTLGSSKKVVVDGNTITVGGSTVDGYKVVKSGNDLVLSRSVVDITNTYTSEAITSDKWHKSTTSAGVTLKNGATLTMKGDGAVTNITVSGTSASTISNASNDLSGVGSLTIGKGTELPTLTITNACDLSGASLSVGINADTLNALVSGQNYTLINCGGTMTLGSGKTVTVGDKTLTVNGDSVDGYSLVQSGNQLNLTREIIVYTGEHSDNITTDNWHRAENVTMVNGATLFAPVGGSTATNTTLSNGNMDIKQGSHVTNITVMGTASTITNSNTDLSGIGSLAIGKNTSTALSSVAISNAANLGSVAISVSASADALYNLTPGAANTVISCGGTLTLGSGKTVTVDGKTVTVGGSAVDGYSAAKVGNDLKVTRSVVDITGTHSTNVTSDKWHKSTTVSGVTLTNGAVLTMKSDGAVSNITATGTSASISNASNDLSGVSSLTIGTNQSAALSSLTITNACDLSDATIMINGTLPTDTTPVTIISGDLTFAEGQTVILNGQEIAINSAYGDYYVNYADNKLTIAMDTFRNMIEVDGLTVIEKDYHGNYSQKKTDGSASLDANGNKTIIGSNTSAAKIATKAATKAMSKSVPAEKLAEEDDFSITGTTITASLYANGYDITLKNLYWNGYVFGGGHTGSAYTELTPNNGLVMGNGEMILDAFGGGYIKANTGEDFTNSPNFNTGITVNSGIDTTYTNELLVAGSYVTGTSKVHGDSTLTINEGADINNTNGYVLGGSYVSGDYDVTGDAVSVISSGVFNRVVGGGLLIKEGAKYTQSGDISLTMTGGTVMQTVMGAVHALNHAWSENNHVVVNGNVNLTFDSSDNDILLHAVYAGCNGQGVIDGVITVTFTGLGSNLTFEGDGAGVCGDNASNIEAGAEERILVFDGFTGDFTAPIIKRFDTIQITSGSTVAVYAKYLQEVETWDFDKNTSFSWANAQNNSFSNDTLNFGCSEEDIADFASWDTGENGYTFFTTNDAGIRNYNRMTVNLFGEATTYEVVEDESNATPDVEFDGTEIAHWTTEMEEGPNCRMSLVETSIENGNDSTYSFVITKIA